MHGVKNNPCALSVLLSPCIMKIYEHIIHHLRICRRPRHLLGSLHASACAGVFGVYQWGITAGSGWCDCEQTNAQKSFSQRSLFHRWVLFCLYCVRSACGIYRICARTLPDMAHADRGIIRHYVRAFHDECIKNPVFES